MWREVAAMRPPARTVASRPPRSHSARSWSAGTWSATVARATLTVRAACRGREQRAEAEERGVERDGERRGRSVEDAGDLRCGAGAGLAEVAEAAEPGLARRPVIDRDRRRPWLTGRGRRSPRARPRRTRAAMRQPDRENRQPDVRREQAGQYVEEGPVGTACPRSPAVEAVVHCHDEGGAGAGHVAPARDARHARTP